MPKPDWNRKYVAGKGSHRRPREVSEETFAENWDRIFGRGQKPQSDCGSDKDARGA
jgi:hypothetical protein